MMGIIRRIGALATGILVLQLTLLGAAAPCTDHGVGGFADAGSGHDAHAPVSSAPAPDAHEDCDGGPAEPTDSGSSSGGCIAMMSCVTPLLLDAQPPVDGGKVINTQVAAPVLEPPTHTTAPELPPPRA
ncbi:MAG TPA: hypothetical protein VFZ56_13415 [Gemmatimonadaceae bacterium]